METVGKWLLVFAVVLAIVGGAASSRLTADQSC
jgi:hypothetical protein